MPIFTSGDSSGGKEGAGPAVMLDEPRSPGGSLIGQSWRRKLVSPLAGFLTGLNTRHRWVQLSGHKDNFVPGSGGTVCKKAAGVIEREAYENLMNNPDESLRGFVPVYFKEETIDGEAYLELEDLLANYSNPCIMDIKIGVRTFLEKEASKKDKRMDLLKKMIKIDPDAPTEEEKAEGISKLRYMMFREELSSTRTLGYRIEGIKLADEEPRTNFQRVHDREEVHAAGHSFLPPVGNPLRAVVRKALHKRLIELRSALQQSAFFAEHEVIGSSLLFLYDHTGRAGVTMIDFGKTMRAPVPITHDVPWEMENHEDGYLIGIDAVIDLFASAVVDVQET